MTLRFPPRWRVGEGPEALTPKPGSLGEAWTIQAPFDRALFIAQVVTIHAASGSRSLVA